MLGCGVLAAFLSPVVLGVLPAAAKVAINGVTGFTIGALSVLLEWRLRRVSVGILAGGVTGASSPRPLQLSSIALQVSGAPG